MADRIVSSEGECLLTMIEQHRANIEKHDCRECFSSYAALIEAITEWVGSFDSDKREADDIFGIKKKRRDNGDGG